MDRADSTQARQPLEGITVLDLTHALAGPLCTAILCDFGARVIKVEKPGSGDIARYMSMKEEKPPDPLQGSTSYLCFNKSKESIALDLSRPEGLQIARDLAQKCDVVVENFRPGVMERLGLGYADLRKLNSGLIFCDISGFGDGPLAGEPGMDLVVQARAGTIATTGEPGGPPMRPGVSLSDMSCGMLAVSGILLALRVRDLTGRGQKVNVSLYDSTLLMLSQYIAPVLNSKMDIEPMGRGHPQLSPYQAYPTADGWIFLGCGTDALFRRLCNALELPQLADDERFRTNPARVKHKDELEAALSQVLRTKSSETWENVLRKHGIPVSPIVTPRNAFLQALEQKSPMVETIEHPRYGQVHVPGRAILLSETPGKTKRYPPRLGEDTERILRGMLSLDEAAVTRLERDKIIAQYRENETTESK